MAHRPPSVKAPTSLPDILMIRNEMEKIYGETPPADIPWNIVSPPQALVELIESGEIQPCKTIDLGCGAGNYAIYLASVGFEVTGVDISPSAIGLAEANARPKMVTWKKQSKLFGSPVTYQKKPASFCHFSTASA